METCDESEDDEQAVFIFLDITSGLGHVFSQTDLASLEESLAEVVERKDLGEFDGDEIGEGSAQLFFYGRDAEQLFGGIEDTLRRCALCRGGRIVIRRGGPGADEREVRL